MYVSWQTDRERQEYDKAYDKKWKIDNPPIKGNEIHQKDGSYKN